MRSRVNDSALFFYLVVLALIACVFKIVPPMVVSKTGGPSGITHLRLALLLEPASPRPLSLAVMRQGICNFMLERDEARWFHSNSIRKVA